MHGLERLRDPLGLLGVGDAVKTLCLGARVADSSQGCRHGNSLTCGKISRGVCVDGGGGCFLIPPFSFSTAFWVFISEQSARVCSTTHG